MTGISSALLHAFIYGEADGRTEHGKDHQLGRLQKGRGRNINEDNLYTARPLFLRGRQPEQEETAASQAACQCYAVADGFGHDGVGAQVSYLAMQVLDQHLAQSRSGRFDFVSFARDLMDPGQPLDRRCLS